MKAYETAIVWTYIGSSLDVDGEMETHFSGMINTKLCAGFKIQSGPYIVPEIRGMYSQYARICVLMVKEVEA